MECKVQKDFLGIGFRWKDEGVAQLERFGGCTQSKGRVFESCLASLINSLKNLC